MNTKLMSKLIITMSEEHCFNCKCNWRKLRKDVLSNDCNEYAELLSVFPADLKHVFAYEETWTGHGPLFVCTSCNASFLKLRDAKTNFSGRTSHSSKIALLLSRSKRIFLNGNDQCLQSESGGILNKKKCHLNRAENDLLEEIEAILPDKEENNERGPFGIDNATYNLPADLKIIEFQEKRPKLQVKKLLLIVGNRVLLNSERKKTQLIRNNTNKEHQELVTCDKCGRNFQDLQLLQDHKNAAHLDSMEYKFSCQFCPLQFSMQWFLKNHVQSRHNGIEIRHSCQVCRQTFQNEKERKEHTFKKHDVREHPFKCVNCVESFAIIQDLRSHLLQHHKASKQAEAAESNIKLMSKQCNYCAEKFSTIIELREHIKLAHDKPNFECEICKKLFISQAELICHQKTHKSCDSCHKSYPKFSQLRTHIENVHQMDASRQYCCEICGQRYFSSIKLLAHYSWHCDVSGPRHFCNACNISFKLRHQLSHHIKKCHTRTLSKYKCEHCDEEFKVKYQLHVHMETVHKAKCDFECKTCGKRFLTSKSVSCHKRIHTMATKFHSGYDKIQNPIARQTFTDVDKIEVTSCFSPDSLLFTCPICSKACESQTHFIRHLRLLHDVMGFKDPNIKLESNIKSPQCEKCFSRKDLLKKHQRKKHMDNSAVFIPNEFECPYCSRILKKCDFVNFVAHIKRHEIFISSVNNKTKVEIEKELSEFYNEKDNTYTCFDCNTKIQRQSYFFNHLKCKRHLNEFKVIFRDEKESKAKFQFQCPKCPKSFPSSSLLTKHKERHSVNRNSSDKRKSQ